MAKPSVERARTFRLVFAAIAAVLVASPLAAQDEGFGGDEDEEQEGGGDEVATEGEGGDGEAANAPETYTVQPGDTLWNLSAKFLNNPWYWPKIWSYNPQLDNPNWIRPGNVIRFYPQDGETPVEVKNDEVADRGDEGEGDEEGDEGDDDEDFDLGDAESVESFQGGRVGEDLRKLANRRGVMNRRQFFVPSSKLDDAGQVENSPDEKDLLTLYDTVWIDFGKKPEPGKVMQVFRPTKTISHPVTGFPMGTVVELVGEVRVDANSSGKSLGTITAAWDTVLRGDYVAEIDEAQIRRVEPSPNEVELKAYVVDTTQFEGTALGQHHLVFIDKGEKDGVKAGNTFTIVRANDPVTGDSRGLTDEVIGRVVITDVRDKTCVGVVSYSNREIIRGDRAEMRTK